MTDEGTSEQGSKEEQVIKEHWQAWNKLVEVKGDEEETGKRYIFTIDRRANEKSQFTSDNIEVEKLNEPLEKYVGYDPQYPRSIEGEEWIQIKVDPKDPFRSRLAIYSEEDRAHYYTEGLVIYLSSHGRALEFTGWTPVLPPDAHKPQDPLYSYLRTYPKPEEIKVELEKEPDIDIHPIERLQPLKGSTLERLDFLLMKIKKGEIIEPKFQSEKGNAFPNNSEG